MFLFPDTLFSTAPHATARSGRTCAANADLPKINVSAIFAANTSTPLNSSIPDTGNTFHAKFISPS